MKQRTPRTRKLIDARLYAWGDWVARPVAGLSHPSRTVEGRMMEEGAGARITGTLLQLVPLYSAHPQEAETNQAVLLLDHDQRITVYARYVHCLPEQQAAYYARCTVRQYYDRLDKAKHWLAGYMRLNMHHRVPAEA